MSRDLASVVRALGAELLPGAVATTAQIDQAVRLVDFTVLAHPDFVTVVVADAATAVSALADGPGHKASLTGAALVVGPASEGQRRRLAASGTTVLCCDADPAVLLPTLVALLANDQAAEDRLVASGTRVLTQVARRGGVGAVVAELAQRIDGWAVLLDSHRQTIASAGAGGLHVQDAVAVAFQRPVRVRHPGLQVHPIGLGEDLAAHLVISSREGSLSRSRSLASQAAALLDLILRTHDHTVTERLGREVMIDALLSGDPVEVRSLLLRWGVRETELTAFVLSSRSKTVDVEQIASRWFDELDCEQIMTVRHGQVLGFIRDDRVEALVDRVEAFDQTAPVPVRCGLGGSASLDALARTAREAAQAHEVAATDGRVLARYRALPTVSYVFDRLEPAAADQLATVLDGLRDGDGRHGELTETLRRYLVEDGSWGVTAERLGIHRQTLRTRMERIEELTGLSMGDPDDRTAAWLGLRALER
ncbi:PucR family transcriptional regulator [Plantibacter sp. YIM 135347]|uniref:PucR family transcriptional regulator n=1 Tax=Plantibacter sp. YIM 135347 TaxID=3423919 RepID=UPI003D34B399